MTNSWPAAWDQEEMWKRPDREGASAVLTAIAVTAAPPCVRVWGRENRQKATWSLIWASRRSGRVSDRGPCVNAIGEDGFLCPHCCKHDVNVAFCLNTVPILWPEIDLCFHERQSCKDETKFPARRHLSQHTKDQPALSVCVETGSPMHTMCPTSWSRFPFIALCSVVSHSRNGFVHHTLSTLTRHPFFVETLDLILIIPYKTKLATACRVCGAAWFMPQWVSDSTCYSSRLSESRGRALPDLRLRRHWVGDHVHFKRVRLIAWKWTELFEPYWRRQAFTETLLRLRVIPPGALWTLFLSDARYWYINVYVEQPGCFLCFMMIYNLTTLHVNLLPAAGSWSRPLNKLCVIWTGR